jgi:hypothetical protein
VESRDAAAGSAFRQMATAWAQLAFSEEFSFPVADEHINQNSEPVPAEKAASSPAAAPITVNEKGVDDSNPAADVDVGNCDHTTRADKTADLSWKHKRLSLRSRISFPKR